MGNKASLDKGTVKSIAETYEIPPKKVHSLHKTWLKVAIIKTLRMGLQRSPRLPSCTQRGPLFIFSVSSPFSLCFPFVLSCEK